MMREVSPCSSLSISKRILLLETKAISVPEKKAEKASTMAISMNILLGISAMFISLS